MSKSGGHGVRILGVGSAVPSRVLANADFEKLVNTSDDWIVQRTGIRERRVIDRNNGESEFGLARDALQRALDDAGIPGSELDIVIHASTSSEYLCPPNASRIADAVGATPAGSFDLIAACSGFVYGTNVADALIRTGGYRTIGVIGCDALSKITDYSDRTVSILFGDAGGAFVLQRDEEPSRGCLYQTMGSDGGRWDMLYMPHHERDIPDWDKDNPIKLHCLRMRGREVFKFAVTKFREVIEDALEQTGLRIDDVAQFVCHQSNLRIIEAAKEKLGLPDEKVHVNIERYGNSSAGSVPLAFDELWRAGKIKPGDHVVMVAFGGGLTWASSVWKV
jgi:3-oxoacyl-[acyl-carrier-protein] synthase-3